MPRLPRLVLPGEPLHVMQRGNNQTPALHGAEGFGRYRALLGAASTAATCAIHAYVLMTNHVHLLIIPADVNGAARLMKEVSQGYARWFNRRPRRTGASGPTHGAKTTRSSPRIRVTWPWAPRLRNARPRTVTFWSTRWTGRCSPGSGASSVLSKLPASCA